MPNKEDFSLTLTPVAFVENDFTGSFGIPRQSGLAKSIVSQIVFCDGFCDKNALRGIEQYSHLWLIWGFSENFSKGFSPTVRPPKLGGNTRVGVFATRSPFRPNPLGLSCVELLGIKSKNGRLCLEVAGADIKSGSPVYDIKPYIPYADIKNGASGGFSEEHKNDFKNVIFEEDVKNALPEDILFSLREVLSLDPKPQYKTGSKVYKMTFGEYEISFLSDGGDITVTNAAKRGKYVPDTKGI